MSNKVKPASDERRELARQMAHENMMGDYPRRQLSILLLELDARIDALRAENAELRALAPHYCADDHTPIYHRDSESELCPLCDMRNELRARAEKLDGALRECDRIYEKDDPGGDYKSYGELAIELAETHAQVEKLTRERDGLQMIAKGREKLMVCYRLGTQRGADAALTLIEKGQRMLEKLDASTPTKEASNAESFKEFLDS